MNRRNSAATNRRCGYTLIEMLCTVAALVIVLGLMVSLARYVRYRSANELTGEMLGRLTDVLAEYQKQHDGALPAAPLLLPLAGATGETPDEAGLQAAALRNNAAFVRALRRQGMDSVRFFADLPLSIYDETILRDPWGMPIVLMAGQNPLIGMAPDNRPFFFSAGPDRLYLTREDNLYSYEEK